MKRDPRGPKIALELTHGVAPMGYVKEMKPDALYEKLAYWINQRNKHGERDGQSFEIKKYAKSMIDSIKQELRRRNLPVMKPQEGKVRCPHCAEDIERYGERYHKVYPKFSEPYLCALRCSFHGCIFVDGEWIFECQECKARTGELFGLPTPYLCKECFAALCEHQRETHQVCPSCHKILARCYC